MKVKNRPVGPSLERFASANAIGDLAAAVAELIKTKDIYFAFKTDKFREGFEKLDRFSRDLSDSATRLLALALLERIRVVLKKDGKEAEEILRRELTKPIPSIQVLSDGEDRYYVASALQIATGTWLSSFVATEIALEPVAEKSRTVLATLLLRNQGTLEKSCSLLSSTFIQALGSSKNDTSFVGRRLRRCLSALRNAIRNVDFEPGPEVARELRVYFRAGFEKSSAVPEPKVARELTDELATFIEELTKIRFSLALDGNLYKILEVSKRWFSGSDWNAYVSRSRNVKALISTITEGIRLSAKQGIPNQNLLDGLDLCAGGREKALKTTRAIADANPGLSTHIQGWLRHGRVDRVDASARIDMESGAIWADQQLATVLLDINGLDSKQASLPSDISSSLKAVSISIRNLAKSRNLELLGSIGEIVEYSPYQHTTGAGPIDTRKVRVLHPGVERKDANGNRNVLVKAIVESVREL